MSKCRKGYALILAILVMAIITVVSVSLAGIVIKGLRMSKGIDDSVVAFYAAESGVEEAMYCISQGVQVCDPTDLIDLPSFRIFSSQARFDRTYTLTLDGSDILIRSTGSFHDSKMALQVRMPAPPSS